VEKNRLMLRRENAVSAVLVRQPPGT
jgi:hypothetical protein